MALNETEDRSLTPQNMRRYDGSQWRQFDSKTGSQTVLTSRGQELLKYNPELRGLLAAYRDEAVAVLNGKGSEFSSQVRRYFRTGGNSRVYKIGDTELLVKEGIKKNRPSLWKALDSMDYLYGVCLKHLDPYVKVPDHYGLFIPKGYQTEYLLMRKINSGITVEDIVKGRVRVDERIKDEVVQDFSDLKPKVLGAIQKTRQNQAIPYRNLLTDWTDRNVLVDLTTRAREKPYTLWIIDQ